MRVVKYFICHSAVDLDLAKEAISILESLGHTTWFAPRDIPAGHPWPDRINEAIRESDVVLLIGSKTALASRHVEREISLADRYERMILPVMVDGISYGRVDYYLCTTNAVVTSRDTFSADLRRHFGVPARQPLYHFLDREPVALPDGSTMTFRRWGDGYSLPVLLVHGLGLSADDWDADAQVAAMRGREATFIAPDLPHHVPWDPDTGTRLPQVAMRLAWLMSALGAEQYAVVGHSLGGAIALHLTARDQRVRWCAAGGVGRDVWDADARSQLATVLRTTTPRDESDAGLLEFLRTRGHDLNGLATLCEGELPPTADLARLADRVSMFTTDDDRTGTDAFTSSASLATALSLPGNHVSSFLSGQFLQAALDLRAGAASSPPAETAPRLLVISGLPGAGKTTVAGHLARSGHLDVLSRDAIRHELWPSPTYSLDESALVAEEVERRSAEALASGRGLILEGTSIQPEVRSGLRERLRVAHRGGYRTAALWLDGLPDVLRARIDSRALEERDALDKSEADGIVFDVMRSRASPGWVGLRCDVTYASAPTIARWCTCMLDGQIPAVDAPNFLLAQAVLSEAADIVAQKGALLDSAWMDALVEQARVDVASGVADRWGLSTLIDENVGRPVINERALEQLLDKAGLSGTAARANAGLAHTYAYLLAHEPTPYGFKRDRWLDGLLERVLGAQRGRLRAPTRSGTLLGNLTAAIDAYVLGREVDWIDRCDTVTSCLVERDPVSGVMARTRVVSRPGVEQRAVIHSVALRDGPERYITAFATTPERAEVLERSAVDTGPLCPRFNTVLPPLSTHQAERDWVSQD